MNGIATALESHRYAPITVLCLWVRGHVDYSAEYVVRLATMVHRFAKGPIRFVCVTDQPARLPAEMDKIVMHPWVGPYAWWNKVRLFNPRLGFDSTELPVGQTVERPLTGRIVYYDLDTLLLRGAHEIASYPAAFALAPHAGNFNPRSHEVVQRFNSSVMAWNAGDQAHIFSGYGSHLPGRYWGDQDWIGTCCPDAAAMPTHWFPRLSEFGLEEHAFRTAPPMWPKDAHVILCKKPKNHEALARYPWFDQAWR